MNTDRNGTRSGNGPEGLFWSGRRSRDPDEVYPLGIYDFCGKREEERGVAEKRGTDWAAIKAAFCSSQKSYRELARQFGVQHTAIYKHAKAEGWTAERERWHDKMLTAAAQAQGTAMAEGMRKCVRVASKLLDRLEEKLDRKNAPLSPQDLRALSGTLTSVMEALTGDLDVEKRRAEIEKLKASLTDEADREIRVVIQGGEGFDG